MKRTIPWPVVNGEKVTTCGVEEEALGLTPVIGGWGPRGYYVPYAARSADPTIAAIDAVDWKRVATVKAQFDIAAVGYMVFTDQPTYFMPERSYKRLLKYCLKAVPEQEFQRRFNDALKNWGKRKETVSGRM